MAVLANEIRIGSLTSPTYKYDNAKIQLNSAKGVFSVDVLGNELAIDTFTATVRYNPDAPLVYAPKGKNGYNTTNPGIYLLKKSADQGAAYLKNLPWGTPVFWLVSGSVFARGYLSKVERISRKMYKITCVSGIGLLEPKMHVGGLYTGQTVTALLSSIIGTTFAYSVAADVGAVAVYGHLPYDTARNNLHRLLFAAGAAMTRDANGNYVVQFLDDTMTNVPSSRVALGGKTEYTTPIDGVEVTEHSYFALNTDEVVTLFDNTAGSTANQLTVVFSEAPVHDLAVSGNLTINAYNVNYAVVTGVGVLTGKKYQHNTQLIRLGTGTNNVKRVTSNELISFANSSSISKRLLAYYSSAKTVNAKILLDGEKPGQLLSLTDGFGDPTNAYLSSMDVLVTTVKGANCKLISGYVPGKGGNNYTHRVLIAASGTWAVPAGVEQIRIVLIGGGSGGQGGYNGSDGMGKYPDGMSWGGHEPHDSDPGLELYGYANAAQTAAVGGSGGAAGAKAKFIMSDVQITAGEVITFNVGVGGAGGAVNGGAGAAGTPTTASSTHVGNISSATGLSLAAYADPMTGDVFAADGTAGTKGGDGGLTDSVDLYAYHGGNGLRGGNAGTYAGGAGGAGTSGETQRRIHYTASGAGGGGAAVGANGSAGGAGKRTLVPREMADHTWQTYDYIFGGDGGNGANAVAPAQPFYGWGGHGGHGGGAGGNGGGLRADSYHNDGMGYSLWFLVFPGAKGLGGSGSVGGKGGNGCAIIYY